MVLKVSTNVHVLEINYLVSLPDLSNLSNLFMKEFRVCINQILWLTIASIYSSLQRNVIVIILH